MIVCEQEIKRLKILIVTVAGTATRFQKEIGGPIIKCLYTEGDMQDSLLCRLLKNFDDIDKYIIVGGYRYEELKETLEREECFDVFMDRIVLVNNDKYEEYGSGYSLYKGLEEAIKYDFKEIIFAEGDLYIDSKSCKEINGSCRNVLTVNTDPIYANKAVALYVDLDGRIHYIYDTSHGSLEINEPFAAIFNSGQVWKLADVARTKETFFKLSEKKWQGTNLVYIEEYFKELSEGEYEVIRFHDWINCNTVSDYQKINNLEGAYEVNE